LYNLLDSPVVWIDKKKMSREEKKKHPEYLTAGGYTKKLSDEERLEKNVQNWKKLSEKQKSIILSIPNFDKEIFKEITGIDVDND